MPLQYLLDYAAKLSTIKNVQDLYGGLLDWQATKSEEGQYAQMAINETLFAGADTAVLLRADHPPTTAVGGFNGVVVVSANPGYDEELNPLEMAIRGTRNRQFCESFFSGEVGNHTRNIRWWKPVAEFAYRAMTPGEMPALAALWNWAATTNQIGAVDLIPFHSRRDGITRLIEQEPTAEDHLMTAQQALRKIAEETFKMVLRLRPRVVVVASKAGQSIAAAVMQEQGHLAKDFWCETVKDAWGHEFRHKLHHFLLPRPDGQQQGETHVLVMPTQLFSGQNTHSGLPGLRKDKLPQKIYQEIIQRVQ